MKDEMEKRVSQLERALKRSRIFSLAILLVIGGALLMGLVGAPEADNVTCKKLTVVDDSGKERAVLGVTPQGPGLFIYDRQGNPKLMMVDSDGGPMMGLMDKNGNAKMVLMDSSDGTVLVISDSKGNQRAVLAATNSGSALVMSDNNNKTRTTLAVENDGRPHLDFFDAGEKQIKTIP